MPNPNKGITMSSRDIKDKLKRELEESSYDHNLKVAKYRLASLIEFCEFNRIKFEDVVSNINSMSKPKRKSRFDEFTK